jgi:hypothetical protein
MEAKWPFMLIAFGLIFALGLTIAKLEKTTVMNNWAKRRCEIPVMAAASFFKPTSDPRSSGEFAKDNFEFCMKTHVDKFTALFMSPIQALFSKQVNLASSGVDGVNTLRGITSTLYNTLLGILDPYFRKFMASVYEISRVVQYMHMAVKRINAIMVAMLYSGLTMFRGMINTIQFVIKVILIICGIMLAIIIILIFVLFPFVPLILSVLGAVVATVLAITMAVTGEIGGLADTANSDKSGFCFAENTMVSVMRNGQHVSVKVQDIKINDELAHNCGKVTATVTMSGENVPLFNINNIIVSGSHLVLGTDNVWKSVAKDERAIPVTTTSPLLYCFNTTSHSIPIISSTNNNTTNTLFRDWEEIEDEDYKGQWLWNYNILKTLNKGTNYTKWKDSLHPGATIPLMSGNTSIKTSQGFVPISSLEINKSYVIGKDGKEHAVLGIIYGEVENVSENSSQTEKWHTELYELNGAGTWIKGKGTLKLDGNANAHGYSIITQSGEFIIWDNATQTEKVVRDFTDIGYKRIHETYPLVASRLRLFKPHYNNKNI